MLDVDVLWVENDELLGDVSLNNDMLLDEFVDDGLSETLNNKFFIAKMLRRKLVDERRCVDELSEVVLDV